MVLPFIPCPLVLMQVLGTLVPNPSSDEGCLDFILCFVNSEVVIYYILPSDELLFYALQLKMGFPTVGILTADYCSQGE